MSVSAHWTHTHTPPAAYCWRKAWPWPLPTSSRGALPVKKGKWEIICIPACCFIASQAQMANSSGRPGPARGPCCHMHGESRPVSGTGLLLLWTRAGLTPPDPRSLAPLRPAEVRKTSHGPVMTAFVPRWLEPESPRAHPYLPAGPGWPPTGWHLRKASGWLFPLWEGTQLTYVEISPVMRRALPI